MKKILLSFSLLILAFTANAQSWTSQATGFDLTSRGLSEIHIVNPTTVWALAYDGLSTTNVIQEFTRTTDGGNTWTPGTINVGDPTLSINNIAPISATTAWVSALTPTIGNNGVIYKTTDAGATWEQQNIGAFNAASSFINGVHFFDANNGISFGDAVAGEFEIYTTSDGGETWDPVPGANIPNPLGSGATIEYGYNGGNVFIGNTAWLVTNRGRILKSTDMGLTWTVSQAPVTDFAGTTQSARLTMSSLTNGCLLKTAGTTYTFYTTTDGGATWSAGTPFTGAYRVLAYVPGTTTLVATSAGTPSGSAYSNNNGTTWIPIDSGAQRGVVTFLDGSTGWCAGFNEDPFTGGIFKFNGTLSNSDFNSSKFRAYPNPTTSLVNLQTEGLDSYTLKVTDLAGKVMVTKEFNGVENTLDISSFATGVYFFEINSGNKSETIKIIKN
ncbi:T9SS type A sorting domain-containing protein [Flavobacterium sp.]|uniref:T9SS type A sorting domain-containing protein n=1 Tax=Flavobacterium sp. TaxID=239 RepID=UPI00391BE7E7